MNSTCTQNADAKCDLRAPLPAKRQREKQRKKRHRQKNKGRKKKREKKDRKKSLMLVTALQSQILRNPENPKKNHTNPAKIVKSNKAHP